jgi:DNA-binding transcriptional ArsR family regulator
MLDDPKVARLPDSSYRRFIECILLAGELDEGGYLPPVMDMAWRLRLDETTLTQDLARLASSELLEIKPDGRWFVTSFEKRQKGLTKQEYMRRLRDERRALLEEDSEPITNGNTKVTEPVTNSKTDKIREDKDKDKDKSKIKRAPSLTLPPSLDNAEFLSTWNEWQKYKGKSIKAVTYEMQLKEAARMVDIYGLQPVIGIFNISMANGWKGLFWDRLDKQAKQPATGNGHYELPDMYKDIIKR